MSASAAPVRRALHWFRGDLRLADNPALLAAAACSETILVFVAESNARLRPRGGASRWWLHHSLAALRAELVKLGAPLHILEGDSEALIPDLAQKLGCERVTWTRRYGEAERACDQAIKTALQARGIEARSFNGNLLYEPMEIRSQAGGPIRVFTPFWKACRALRLPEAPLAAPGKIQAAAIAPAEWGPAQRSLEALGLLPHSPDWSGGLADAFTPGEAGAKASLAAFLDGPLAGYAEQRDRPDFVSTSRLSPHLAFGEISPRQIWQAVEHRFAAGTLAASRRDIDKFFAELGWREFAYHLLFHVPDLVGTNFQRRFDAFPWIEDRARLSAWQKGLTGYPMVDAGMRELWRHGFMHNRVRMITASFLIKHLMIDWRVGEAWFWDTLCDADPANNAASWQWVAGSGADAAPYFRIFNPFTQGEKFDPEGQYIRRFVPELAKLPNGYIHRPWDAPPAILRAAGIELGRDYPAPIVDHDAARARALAAFQSLKGEAGLAASEPA